VRGARDWSGEAGRATVEHRARCPNRSLTLAAP
jgi:hypothetical protein